MHYGWASPSLPQLLAEDSLIPITNEEGSWLAVIPMLAAIIGALAASRLLDLIGRKFTILLITPPYFASWILIGIADSTTTLYISRFLAGLADGITFTAIPMYIGEIADREIRGMLGTSMSVTLITGVLLINLIGTYFSVYTTAMIVSTLPLIMFVTFMWMPESPYYLIMKDNIDGAIESLKKLKGIDDVTSQIDVISETILLEKSSSFLDLFRVNSNRKALLLMIGLRTVQQLSGISAFTVYTKMIFQQAGGSLSADASTLLYSVVQLIVSTFSAAVVDTTGRRPLLIISTIGSSFALVAEGLYFYLKDEISFDVSDLGWLPVTALIGYVIIYSLGLGTIPVLMLGEVFATNIKAHALCFMDIYFSILATVVAKFYQLMMDNYGIFVPFWVFTACCALGLIFIILCIPETKGKSLEEIQMYLKGELPLESRDENQTRIKTIA